MTNDIRVSDKGLDRRRRALAHVRRLIRTGNNSSYWRNRERELLAALASLSQKDQTNEQERG
jgi:hypothetical protein